MPTVEPTDEADRPSRGSGSSPEPARKFLAVSHPHLNLERRASHNSDDCESSDGKRVSFNNDVRIKRIPNKSTSNHHGAPPFKVQREAVPDDPVVIQAEADRIVKQLEVVECSVSANRDDLSRQKLVHGGSLTSLNKGMRLNVNKEEAKSDNRLYGLHALNNLDIAVNGKEVNSMPSYQEIRRRGGSLTNNSSSTDSVGNDNAYDKATSDNDYCGGNPPPKPPRKVTNVVPERENMNSTYYAQPAFSGLHQSSPSSTLTRKELKLRKRLMQEADDSAIASGGDADDSTVTSSYTSRFRRKSPPPRSSTRMSPSRSCLTDTDILRSPTEVLYAVSDKHKHNNNEHLAHTSSQTMDIQQRPRSGRPRSTAYHYSAYGHPNDDESSYVSKASGRRSTSGDNYASRYSRYPPARASVHNSRSLDRTRLDDDIDLVDLEEANKENSAFKTRIQVISPERREVATNRKPYKTTINTANDNIQYRGSSQENIYASTLNRAKKYHNKPAMHRMVNNFSANDSDHSSHRAAQFTSTRLVKNADSSRRAAYGGDRDREGRSIRRDAGAIPSRGRHYSGSSLSPDASPDSRYRTTQRPTTYNNGTLRSPSSSPTRPPRSRSSPVREMHQPSVVRRVSTRRDADPGRYGGDVRPREGTLSRRSLGYQNGPSVKAYGATEDRLSRFTEYRGEDLPAVGQHAVVERERGHSLPPGASIDGIRDFYKSSQYKSMYALPPSPTRPAPVLDRERGSMTLQRPGRRASPGRDSEVMDSSSSTMGRVRHRPASRNGRPAGSTKRLAPSPPVAPSTGKGLVVRRVVSSDGRRTAPVQQPPGSSRRLMMGRRSSVDQLDSSFSESEGFNGEPDPEKQPLGEFGKRWASNHSDIDSDYRRELATSGVGLHQEARARDGGGSVPGWTSSTTGRLSKAMSMRSANDDSSDIHIANDSAREEERRKVIEIEGAIHQPRTGRTAHVANAGPRGYKPAIRQSLSVGLEPDRESQYSSRTNGTANGGTLNRFDQHRVGVVGRVRRTPSSANAVGGIRMGRKIPGKNAGSLTSSVNSSESEHGSHAGRSGISRNTSASQRSVFLHAAAVADIPSQPEAPIGRPSQRALSADSGSGAPGTPNRAPVANVPPQSNLKGSKKISRSISLLTPWKPKPVQDRFEIHYNNDNLYANPATRITVDGGSSNAKPPRPPTAPPPPPVTNSTLSRRAASRQPSNKRSASSNDLLRDSDGSTTPAVILAERRAKAAERKKAAKVSRSVSMPKDTRLAGWFRKRKRVPAS